MALYEVVIIGEEGRILPKKTTKLDDRQLLPIRLVQQKGSIIHSALLDPSTTVSTTQAEEWMNPQKTMIFMTIDDPTITTARTITTVSGTTMEYQ